ncbi:MAG: hypothetical protein R3F55_01985 [Alphaproteobacteria bacterium]
MLRLIIVLAIAFAASQFPRFYQSYLFATDADLRQAMAAGAPSWQVDLLKSQRTDLLAADEPHMQVATFVENFDGDRALRVISDDFEPQIPEDGIGWAFGGVGLLAGFLLTAILFAPFRSRRRVITPAAPRPARQAQARTQRAASRIPVSGGGLNAAIKAAQQMADQVKQAAQSGAAAVQTGQAAAGKSGAIQLSQVRRLSAITTAYSRPPAITRPRGIGFEGPIARRVQLRD